MKKKEETEKYKMITKIECPKCGSIKLSSWIKFGPGLGLTKVKAGGFTNMFYYECDDCGAICYSLGELK